MVRAPNVKVVSHVTRQHGEAFVEAWFERTVDVMWQACDDTEIMEWPEWDQTAQNRYAVLQDEICDQVFRATRAAIAEAFTKAARKVLARERKRQK